MTQTTEAVEATGVTENNIGGLLYEAIPAGVLDVIRAAGRDEAGNPLEVVQSAGSPVRCCLREDAVRCSSTRSGARAT
jgi:hypothetical protein